MYLPEPSTSAKMQHKVNKRKVTGLESEFSFSKTNCHSKVKEPTLPYNLFPARKRDECMPFSRALTKKWNTNSTINMQI